MHSSTPASNKTDFRPDGGLESRASGSASGVAISIGLGILLLAVIIGIAMRVYLLYYIPYGAEPMLLSRIQTQEKQRTATAARLRSMNYILCNVVKRSTDTKPEDLEHGVEGRSDSKQATNYLLLGRPDSSCSSTSGVRTINVDTCKLAYSCMPL
jgi:hypothetical protein